MKNSKKTLSYCTARKLDFALFLTLSVGISYMLTVHLCGRQINYIVAALLCLVALFSAGAELFFRKDRDDELARYEMSLAHEKMSKAIPWFIIAVPLIFLFLIKDFTITIDNFDALLIIILQPSLYLTAEQALFLFIHGRESGDNTEDESNE